MNAKSVGKIILILLVVISLVCGAGTFAYAANDNQYAFSLDMAVQVNPEDETVLDVVVTIKDITRELDAVEFELYFDKNIVAGVITESGEQMDAFITRAPMYDFQVAGVEVPVLRYEQICTYSQQKGRYMCRFIDKVSYPGARPGQTYWGLKKDGELVITIPFRLLDGMSADAPMTFSITNVKGTTRGSLESVDGKGMSVALNGNVHVHDWLDATCIAPKTCKDCGATEGKRGKHVDADADQICDYCRYDVYLNEDAAESPETGDVSLLAAKLILVITFSGLVALVTLPGMKRFS